MSWTKRPKAALILAAALASAAVSAQVPSVTLVLTDDATAVDISPAAELLVRHGAPVIPTVLPPGRVRSVLKEPAPACGLEVVRSLDDRADFQWIAKTASLDYVAAGLTEGDNHPIAPQTTAVAAMNTVSQAVAAKAGYTLLPIKTMSQAVPLLRSGRAAVVVAVRQELDNLSVTEGVTLHVETVLAHGETWLACNSHVSTGDLERITAAWNEARASGELRDFYAKAGVLSLYPGP